MINKITKEEWDFCQRYERESWGNDIFLNLENVEVRKQNFYAHLMGLTENIEEVKIDLKNKTVLDVGCGPVSLLLRSFNFKKAIGIEPLDYGDEIKKVFLNHNINLLNIPAEEMDFNENEFDEIWLYNVLQHVYDPVLILEKIQKFGKTIRLFEWLDIPPHLGHPHMFTEDFFIKNLNLKETEYKITIFNDNELRGKSISIIKKCT